MKIALMGYGRMGRAVEAVARERGYEVVARLRAADVKDGLGAGALGDAELAFEFSVPEAAAANIESAAAAGVDVVAGTTGWYGELERVRSAVEAAGVGLIYAPNFSLGVQAFFRLARLAARLADRLEAWDVYVLEAHHRHKKDHPSGTAERLAEIVLAESSRKREWRATPGSGPIAPDVLQVASIRAGEIPGMHMLGLEGPDDRIEVRHESRGRSAFARGAVTAAEWVRGRRGVYTIDDLLSETFGPRENV